MTNPSNQSSDSNPLEFMTDEELLDELSRRCVSLVFLSAKEPIVETDVTNIRIHGSLFMALGLATFLQDYIQEMTRQVNEVDEDE